MHQHATSALTHLNLCCISYISIQHPLTLSWLYDLALCIQTYPIYTIQSSIIAHFIYLHKIESQSNIKYGMYPNLDNNPTNHNQYNPYSQPNNQYNPNNNYNQTNFQSNGYNQMGGFQNNMSGYRGIMDNARHHDKPDSQYNDRPYDADSPDDLSISARVGFIRKVYTLVTIQLLVTSAIGFIGYNSTGFKNTFGNTAMVIVLSVVMLALSIVIGCCTDFFRKYALPIFILFTVVVSLLVAVCVSAYKSNVVLTAVVITLVLVVGLTLYAWFTKTDFTGLGPYLLVFCLLLMVFGIILIFWKNPIAHLIYACLGALLFSIYLIFDTQLILGKGQYSYSLDDAYLAAIQLYMDIINLFLYLLQIIGAVNN